MLYNYTFKGRLYSFTRPAPEHYGFEESIDPYALEGLVKNHWHYTIYISVLYLAVVFLLKQYMKSRPPFNLTFWMALWNLLFATYNTYCFLRGIKYLIFFFEQLSFLTMACDSILIRHYHFILFWGWIFLHSKFLELVETFFIVLSKKKLLFLHCYHHAATLVLAWYLTAKEVATFLLMGYVNTAVHSAMYTYFTFKSLGYKIPRFVPMIITAIQIFQMVFGVLVSVMVYWIRSQAEQCDGPADVLNFPFCIYVTYAILFSHLFYTSYINPDKVRKKEA